MNTSAIFIRSKRCLLTVILVLLFGTVMATGSAMVYAAPSENSPEGREALNQENIPERAGDPAEGESPYLLIDRYINPAIAFLSAVVGLVVVISIVVGGIQYASSGDDPQKVSKAKSRIFNSLLGLLAWLFLSAFLEWLIPGGIL